MVRHAVVVEGGARSVVLGVRVGESKVGGYFGDVVFKVLEWQDLACRCIPRASVSGNCNWHGGLCSEQFSVKLRNAN